MKAHEWIDRLKEARGLDSDYKAAKALGVKPQTVSNYRARGSTLDDEMAMRVASALGAPPEAVILDQTMERTKNDEARSALAGLLKRLGWAPAPASDTKGGLYIM
ncbi:helix-turn-helix domain-containing protein [uncultured Hydrogenophaga sp.]|uniref:helix-turn-helix domain-containing protein n=1 Tax=uncultured Hydrogenophaga sp. TaxID=199683 RepID=UPI002588FCA6|nr:helix-turn-helix domain-containing protein [uncultured Hydrogenophaga sp.]